MKKKIKITDTIVFDLETPLIPKCADEVERVKAIEKLKISVLCCYDYNVGEYLFFTGRNISDFISLTRKRKMIVGFNILGFDYLVLKKHGLSKAGSKKAVDIFDIIRNETGEWLSLDALSKENLGRGKLIKGKELANADIVTLYQGCKADVENTKELYELYLLKKLKYKHLKGTKRQYFVDEEYIEPGDMNGYIPFKKCPKCGGSHLQKFDELEDGMEEMTDGQFAEYMAGTWGTVECLDCGASIDYDI